MKYIGEFKNGQIEGEGTMYYNNKEIYKGIMKDKKKEGYGGVNQGLMECLGKAAKEHGAMTIGVVPMIVEKSGRLSDFVEVEIPCDNLTDRKQLMMDQADVFIALPGGIGTMDEVFTVAASATIGYHDKQVILYNMKGFWNPLIAMLDELQGKGMIRGSWRDYIKTADSIEEISRLI